MTCTYTTAYGRWSRRLAGRLLPSLAGGAVLTGCVEDRTGRFEEGVLLVTRDDGAFESAWMLEMGRYLERVTGEVPTFVRVDPNTAESGALEALAREHRTGLMVVLDAQALEPERFDFQRMAALRGDGFAIDVEDVGTWANPLDDEPGATIVMTAATSRLGHQYAAYEVLRRLGVRFYHPEQEYVPRHEPGDLRGLVHTPTVLHREGADYVPDFEWRSWSFHSAHPLEILEAFSDGNHPIAEAANVTDWTIKNKGNRFKGPGRGVTDGIVRERREVELETLRTTHGFARGAGITLHNEQQGATAEIDPTSPVPIREQIETLVEEKLAEVPDAQWFGIHFGPTEFTVTPDQETVDWINWAGQKALALRPGIQVEINVHITGAQTTENFSDLGCPNQTNERGRSDYYDLAFHTDPRLGANVHTVMFYPLEGPARVYNQKSFAHKACLMQQASAAGRPLTWFPEGSWWLSFDNTIPVYLPLYIWARGRDIEIVRPLLASRGEGSLRGHRMFNSGQEWGYWQQDYAVGLWAWNADVTVDEVLGEIFDPLCEPSAWRTGCPARTEAISVLEEVMAAQRDWFLERPDWQGRPGGLYAYFAGEDQADEIAAISGFEFRPVRVSFDTVNAWRDDALDLFEETDVAALEEIAAAHEPWLARLEAIRPQIGADGLVWFDEVVDGIEINALRARQSLWLYRAVLAYRRADRAQASDPAAAAGGAWEQAQQALQEASVVIRRREASYRYPPEQSYGGGLTPQTAVDNGTTYPFRVHTKTHLLTYWHNRNEQVRTILEGGDASTAQTVQLVEALDVAGAPLTVSWPESPGLGGSILVGDDRLTVGDPGPVDLGSGEGYWPVSGELTTDGRTIDVAGGVARTDVQSVTPASGVMLTEPSNPTAQSVLAGVFPSLRWGWLEAAGALVVAPDPDEDGSVPFSDLVHAGLSAGDAAGFTTVPVTLPVPVALSSGGSTLTITLSDTTISGVVGPEGLQNPVSMEGRISVPDLVAALRDLAGFDEAGAIQTLAGILEFDPSNPPSTVPYAAQLEIE